MSKNIVIGLLVVIAVLALGGYYLFYTDVADDTVNPVVVNPITENPTPTPTPPVSPQPEAPTVQTGISFVTSNSTATLNGKVNPNGAPATYWFEYGEGTSLVSATVSQQIGSGYYLIPAPAYISGLKANTTYYYRLSAKNIFGTINGEKYTFQTNNNPAFPGITPTARTNNATTISRTSANLNGGVNPNGSQASYWFEYGKDTNLGNITTYQDTNNGSSLMLVVVTLSGLEPLTKYYFRMNAQNQYGTANGSVLSFSTTGPALFSPPTASTGSASNITSTGAMMNGQINPNGVVANYWFEYSQDALLATALRTETSIQTLSIGDSSVGVKESLTDLTRNTRYYYRLVGKNAYGTMEGSITSFRTKN